MDVVDFLQLSVVFRLLMVFFLGHVALIMFRRQNNHWKAPALMALVYILLTWVNVPILFELNLTFDYQVMHALFMLSANALRVATIFYLPSAPTVGRIFSLRNPRLKYVLLFTYLFLVMVLISVQGFVPDMTSTSVGIFYQTIDFATSLFSVGIYSWFLWRSYLFLWPQKNDNRLFGIVLGLLNTVAIYMMISTMMVNEPFFGSLTKLVSFSIFFLWLGINLWYFQSLGLFFRAESVPVEFVARANRLEVQSTVGIHLVWKQGLYKIGIKVLKTDGTTKWHWVERNKLNKSLGHWLAFALGTKAQANLTHGDMNVIKFRMLEIWNKASDQVLQQKHLFEGQRGAYGFICQHGQVIIEISPDLLLNTLLKDALLDFDHVWIGTDSFKKANLGKSKVRLDENRWVEELLRNFAK